MRYDTKVNRNISFFGDLKRLLNYPLKFSRHRLFHNPRRKDHHKAQLSLFTVADGTNASNHLFYLLVYNIEGLIFWGLVDYIGGFDAEDKVLGFVSIRYHRCWGRIGQRISRGRPS